MSSTTFTGSIVTASFAFVFSVGVVIWLATVARCDFRRIGLVPVFGGVMLAAALTGMWIWSAWEIRCAIVAQSLAPPTVASSCACGWDPSSDLPHRAAAR